MKLAPIVLGIFSLNLSSWYRTIMDDFPTEASPSSISFASILLIIIKLFIHQYFFFDILCCNYTNFLILYFLDFLCFLIFITFNSNHFNLMPMNLIIKIYYLIFLSNQLLDFLHVLQDTLLNRNQIIHLL